MTKLCLRPEDAAPILGKSPKNIRRDMRRGVLDLGLVIPPEKSGKTTWEFRIYPAKVEKIIGESLEEFYARRSREGAASDERQGALCSGGAFPFGQERASGYHPFIIFRR